MAEKETSPSWCLIESDPAIFTGLIEDLGVEGLQVEVRYMSPFGLLFIFD